MIRRCCNGGVNPSPSPSPKNGSYKGELRTAELHPTLVPAVLRVPWDHSDCPIAFFSYSIRLLPLPPDRDYRPFGLFLRSRLPAEVENTEIVLHLAKRRLVRASFVSLGSISFTADDIVAGEMFQEMWLKILLDREEFQADFMPLGEGVHELTDESTFYLLLPVVGGAVDWGTVRRCLSSPMFRPPGFAGECFDARPSVAMHLKNGTVALDDIIGSLVFNQGNMAFFFVDGVESNKKRSKDQLLYPDQPLLCVKRLFSLRNLLLNTLKDTAGKTEVRCKVEDFRFLPPEFCSLKILGFGKDIGSSLSLLPSLMHQLQNLLVAMELKTVLSSSFSDGSTISASRIFEALTTAQCLECSSLERLEFLGDAFLKYAVAQHMFLSDESLNEGQLTERRKNSTNNMFLYELAVKKHLQVYIHDGPFILSQFFALGRPCRLICTNDIQTTIHLQIGSDNSKYCNVKCSKSHRWLYRDTIADVVEALIGACLIDGGFMAAIAFLKWLGIPAGAGFDSADAFKIMQNNLCDFFLLESMDINNLEQELSYTFKNKGVLLEALVHPSCNHVSLKSYQRLEFLGDSVLDYLITSYIYSVYPDLDPGYLTMLRSIAVNNFAFAQVAIQHNLHLHLIKNSISLTDAIANFEAFVCMPECKEDFLEEPPLPKVLADIVESCFGAILLDSGFDLICIWRVFLKLLDPILSFNRMQINPLQELQECFPDCKFNKFQVEGKRTYTVQVAIRSNDVPLLFSGTSSNSWTAAKIASQKALNHLKDLGHIEVRKSLEETLKATTKEEAKLIGYEERSISNGGLQDSQMVQNHYMDPSTEELRLEASAQLLTAGRNSIGIKSPCRGVNSLLNFIPSLRENKMKSETTVNRNETNGHCTVSSEAIVVGCDTHNSGKASLKLLLLNICAANSLCPFFSYRECSSANEEKFRCKVTVVLETGTILECISDPKPTGISAEEHAAEGAIWYLEHEGLGFR